MFRDGRSGGDYNNDGWPRYLSNLPGWKQTFQINSGDGTFTDVTKQAGIADGRWSTGASFGDYDGDGNLDLMVTNYVDFHTRCFRNVGNVPSPL